MKGRDGEVIGALVGARSLEEEREIAKAWNKGVQKEKRARDAREVKRVEAMLAEKRAREAKRVEAVKGEKGGPVNKGKPVPEKEGKPEEEK